MNSSNIKEIRRNKSFEETHQELLETAVRLIAEKGVDSLSIAALARAIGINRTTVYYHFDSREQLIREVKAWSSEQLAGAFRPDKPRQDRMEHIFRFVLENPELLKIWLEDFISGGDIRQLYPHWDELVEGIREQFAGSDDENSIDPEVFSINLLTSAFIAPRVFKNSICPEADDQTVVKRFMGETLRMLRGLSLIEE